MMTLILVTSAENNFTAQDNCQIWAIRLRHMSRCCWKGATAVSLKVVSECFMSSDEDNRPLGTCGSMRRFGVLGHDASGAVRDTVLVPPMGSVTIAFDANNPGRWAFHCHNLYHMMTGVMTEVRYPAII
jgi:hypothetical protein